MSDEPTTAPTPAKRRWRFSLRALLIATPLAAVLLALAIRFLGLAVPVGCTAVVVVLMGLVKWLTGRRR